MQKVELLAPAGDLETCKVALLAGADAVYIAGKNFGARAFSKNFTDEELCEAIEYAHIRRKKVYITVNTIVYNEEMNAAFDYIKYLYEIHADALIIQDLGLLRFVREKFPDFEVHASTQMNIYDVKGALALQKLGVKRVVLARETPLEVVQKIAELSIETEIFIHGALCFCASGNCLMSYAIGKRSGNRGKCAQPCRKKYTLLEDGRRLNTNESLLSMKDLNTIDKIDQIINNKVTSLKIEGRMKSKEYVYAVVSSYRKTIDAYYQTKKIKINSIINERLLVTFNREFTKGYLFKEKNHLLTNIKTVNHQGLSIGKVISSTKNYVEIKLTHPLRINDAIRIVSEEEIGFVVNKMFVNSIDVKEAIIGEIVKIPIQKYIKIGSIVVKTKDAEIEKETKVLLEEETIKEDVLVTLFIHYQEEAKLILKAKKIQVEVKGPILNEISNKQVDELFFEERLNKTKDTPFIFKKIIIDYDKIAYISVKDINELRRNAIQALEEKIKTSFQRQMVVPYIEKPKYPKTSEFSLEAIVHTKEQYDICKEKGIEVIYTDFPSELENGPRLINVSGKGIVQNIGNMFDGCTCSSYLNVVNNEAIKMLLAMGANKIYLSNELEVNQLDSFSKIAKEVDLGIMVYGKMDLMVTKHCFISKLKGETFKHCNQCQNHYYELMDEYHNKMRVFTNPVYDCSLRILDYNKRDWLNDMNQIKKSNIRKWLLVFTDESKEIVKNILEKYQSILNK